MYFETGDFIFKYYIMKIDYAQAPGTRGAAAHPLELRFYRVKIFKVGKISFFVLVGPPLGKNRSQAPGYLGIVNM